MKCLKPILILMLLLGAAASEGAWARHGHGRVGVGVVIGAPLLGWPGYYYPIFLSWPARI